MKKITFIFAVMVFSAGIAVISCTKENTSSTSPEITSATDAVQIDYNSTEISGTIDDYQTLNVTSFTDPTLKAGVADIPTSTMGLNIDNCAKVTMVKTPVLTGTAVTGATLKFTIDFGTTGCIGKDGKARRGTIISTYTWVKLSGWSRESAIDLYISDVHYVGTQSLTVGVTGPNNHLLFTENATLKVTAKDGSWKNWTSTRLRELIEGNGGVNPIKIFKITGNSTFSNSALGSSTYTIDVPLIKRSDCKTFTSGTVIIVNKAGVTTTIDYTTVGVNCPDGYNIKTPADKNGKGGMMRFIKWAK